MLEAIIRSAFVEERTKDSMGNPIWVIRIDAEVEKFTPTIVQKIWDGVRRFLSLPPGEFHFCNNGAMNYHISGK